MKLLLTWLLGVPALVGAMVLARATSPQGFSPPRETSHAATSCVRQDQFDHVRPMVSKQRHGITCDRRTVE